MHLLPHSSCLFCTRCVLSFFRTFLSFLQLSFITKSFLARSRVGQFSFSLIEIFGFLFQRRISSNFQMDISCMYFKNLSIYIRSIIKIVDSFCSFAIKCMNNFKQIDLSCTASNLTSKLIFLYVNRVANKF